MMVSGAKKPSDLLARQLQYWRRRRRLSAQELADRVAEIGGLISRATIAKIENRTQKTVTVDQWLMLAHALAVPPPMLLCDLEGGTDVEVAPGAVVHPWLAWEWITGEVAPVITGRVQTRRAEWMDARKVLGLHRREVAAVKAVMRAENAIADAESGLVDGEHAVRDARREYVDSLRALAGAVDAMTEAGVVPPGLPADWVAVMRRHRMLRYPDHVTVYEAEANGASE